MENSDAKKTKNVLTDVLKKTSTRSKLTFIYMMTVIILTVTLISVFHVMGYTVFRNQFQSQLSALAKSKSTQVVSILEQDLERTRLIASRTQMRLSLIELQKQESDPEKSRTLIVNIIKDAKKSVPDIRGIDILAMNGFVVASTEEAAIGQDVSQHATFVNALIEPFQSDFFRDPQGDSYYILSMPLTNPHSNENEVIGVVRVEIALVGLMSALEDYDGLGETGEVLLLASEGDQVIPLNEFRRGSDESFLRTASKILDTTKAKEPVSLWGSKVFLAYYRVPLESKSWYILVKIDASEVMKEFSVVYSYIMLLSFLLLFFGYVVIKIGIDYSFKNIQKLAEGAHRLGRGELSYRIDVMEKDEIGQLSSDFNMMADAMSEQIKTILLAKQDLESEILERIKVEEDLEKAKLSAEAASLAKGEFLAYMSHEIRTPMNGVVGFLKLLEKSSLDSQQKDYIKIMEESAHTLLSVINDILDISKIEAGKLEIEHIEFNVHETIKHAVLPFSLKAKEKGLNLVTSLTQEVPQFSFGDPTKLKQIITNLVGNAMKFTDAGEISVDASVVEKDDAFTYIRLSVKDTGIGMSQETIHKLFKPFTQADSSSTRKYGGTGLGLSLCKAYVEAMNGELTVKSVVGQGSEFICVIPFGQDNKQIVELTTLDKGESDSDGTMRVVDGTIKPVDPTIAQGQGQGMEILVVDDNSVNCILITKLLEAMGLSCDLAVNGEEALMACQEKAYDLIFMDCQMPVLDGYETTRRLRLSKGLNSQTKIVAMTAYVMDGDREKCLEAGMDDYMSKPIDVALLRKIVRMSWFTS